jgi:hypothetical protein
MMTKGENKIGDIMQLTELRGTYSEMGKQYGTIMKKSIQENIKILIYRDGYEALPVNDNDFKSWIDSQEKLIEKNWPWLIEEMNGVADGENVLYREILMLNLRVW